MVWLSAKEEFEPECNIPTVKHGGGNIKCVGCFSSPDAGSLIFINGDMMCEPYREILENNLLKSVEKLGMSHDWIIQHDNDPKHKAAVVANSLNRNGVEQLHWSSLSPDSNPIEHMWDEVKQRLKKKQPKSQNEFKESIIEVRYEIELPTWKLVDSVPNRLNEVIRTKAYPTRC